MAKIRAIANALQEGGVRRLACKTADWADCNLLPVTSKWGINTLIGHDMRQFEYKYGYRFDVRNPVSFTEKVHTYKLLYQDPTMSRVVDKYDFKSYVAETLGSDKYVAKPYGVWGSIDELRDSWGGLPNEFVLKSTISSDGNNIAFIEDKESLDCEALLRMAESWLLPENTQLNGFSRAYFSCKPRILAEEYLHEIGRKELTDYKFFCFDGEVSFVYATARTFEGDGAPGDADYPRTFFDLEWNKLDVSLADHPTSGSEKRPEHFDLMIDMSTVLSRGFPFVRVDFYDLPSGPLLGEMTFYPTGGMKPLKPESFDRELGELFILPEERLVRF